MSEKMKISHQPPELRPNPSEVQFTPETGAINFDGLIEAYHGIRAIISQKRMERAADRLEKMDHKDSLYTQVGVRYMGGSRDTESGHVPQRILNETSTSNPSVWHFPDGTDQPETAIATTTRARTVFEKIKIQRMEAKRHKLKVTRDKRKFHENAFHIYETQDPAFRDGKRSALEIMPSSPIDTSSGRARNLNRVRQLGAKFSYYTSEDMQPEERRAKLNRTKVQITPQESRGQSKHRRAEERAVGKLIASSDQPVIGAWRQVRRNRAIESIKKHYHNTNKHRERQERVGN